MISRENEGWKKKNLCDPLGMAAGRWAVGKGSAKELGVRFKDWIWRSRGRDEYLQLPFLFSWPECSSD